uniref:diacylglycerol O-acyltransferase n=1 Tax=Strigamia maritima TaxID=126957 RepID=T1IZR7_STRMM
MAKSKAQMQPTQGDQSGLQTAAVLLVFSMFALMITSFFITFYLLFYTDYYYLSVLYFIWLWWDRSKCNRGGRRCTWIREWKLWTYIAEYFPIKILKTAELDPNKNYVCGYHPHGLFPLGFTSCFATEATGFSKLFPQIKPSILLLLLHFWIPLHRELILGLGACLVSRESISWLLTKEGKGNMLVIIVGGGLEMLDSISGVVKLTLKNRKGFVRLAIQHGASLIPIFGFGENEIYSQVANPKGSMLRKVQDFLYDHYRMAMPLFSMRGMFPSQQPLDVVIGKPIDVGQNSQPTEEEIDHYHKVMNWMRNATVWKYMKDYFPVRTIKTAELDPNKNYVCGYHPHGILCVGAFTSFATEATGFKHIFPKIKPFLLTLTGQFWFPFYRDLIMSTGSCAVSKESIKWLLTNEGKGNMVIIVIGGAAEALDAHPGMVKLTLRRRKGFVRLAIQNGASLIPIFSFGENNIWSQVPNSEGSILRTVQNYLTKFMGFSPPIIYGRGIFQYSIGYMPYRYPVDIIVGKPIDVVQNPNPSKEEVDKYHNLYIQSLHQLFEEHKINYEHYKDVTLELVA